MGYPDRPVVIVDDEPHILTGFSVELKYNGIRNILTCSDPESVMPLLDTTPVSMVFLDLMMPGLSGRDLLDRIRQSHPDIPVVVVTASNDLETAVDCMKQGAHDFLAKPLEPGRLASVCRHTLEYLDMKQEIGRLRKTLINPESDDHPAFKEIITNTPEMKAIFRYLSCVATTSQPLFVTGETGTGKDLVAQAVHTLSNRKAPLVKINTAGLDDTMFADTLFGHVRGAFTGAETPRAGLVERAGTGTLFLDEIGDLSPLSQVKLLGLIQDREYMRIGEDTVRFSGARIIAATNRKISDLKNPEKFRQDLFFRLMTHHVHLPPLRERTDDILPLTRHFIHKAAQDIGVDPPEIGSDAMGLLYRYRFPGNIRELEGMIFDAVSTCRDKALSPEVFQRHMDQTALEISPGTGPASAKTRGTESDFSLFTTLPTLKYASELLIQEALKRADGNQSEAARILGISRQALNKRLKTPE